MPTTQHAEIERKFDVAQATAVPDLRGVHGIAGLGAPTTFRLTAAYLDTAGLDLARRHITLRRREGGADAGWHLKVESGRDERTEHRCPLGVSESVPEGLSDLIRGVVHDRPLELVARLHTRRTETPLLDRAGDVLALLCDDEVEAETYAPDPTTAGRGDPVPESTMRWREWEIELVGGDRSLLAAAARVLLAAGAHPGVSPSKLAHALGDRLPEPEAHVAHDPKTMSTAALLRRRLVRQLLALEVQDRAFRAGEPTAVHQMRIATRRLRSALATFAPVLLDGTTERYREDLRWLGLTLGAARDAEVLHARLRAELATLPPDEVVGPVADRIDRSFEQEYAVGRREALEALTSPRYYRLLDDLEACAHDLPIGPSGAHRATETVPELLRRDADRFTRAAAQVAHETDREVRDTALHETRKKAKRLRYLAETAVPVYGKRAKRVVRRAKRVQETLGIHQDAVVARERLAHVAAQAKEAGEDTSTYERLQVLETAAALRAEAAYDAVLPDLYRGALPRLSRG